MKTNQEKPRIIKGNFFKDNRGILRFVNDFNFEGIKRFYLIKHPDTSFVRAWQGHQYENKYFYPVNGSFVVAWVEIDNFENPSNNLIAQYHILSEDKSEILYIPKGYANGLKALSQDAEIMIFSDMDLKESSEEKIRFSKDYWLDWNIF